MACSISFPFSEEALRKMSGQHFIFPYYHLVADEAPLHIKNLYRPINLKQFQADLDFLQKHFQAASVGQVKAFVENGKVADEPLFFLSFDDGMRECYDVIYPILKERNIEAAFYINPAFLDNKTLFYKHKISLIIEALKAGEGRAGQVAKLMNFDDDSRESLIFRVLELVDVELIDGIAKLLEINFHEYLESVKPYMTLRQTKEIQEAGFLIGSHSYDHTHFNNLSGEEMQGQLIKSFAFIDEYFKPATRSFAFPFYDMGVPKSFFEFLKEEMKQPKSLYLVYNCTLHYARGMAMAALERVAEAEKEQELSITKRPARQHDRPRESGAGSHLA